MDNYDVKKVPTPEEIAFQQEAKAIFDEISQVLTKHPGWELNPTLSVTPRGIVPNISLEKKNVEPVIPEPPIVTP